MQATSYYRAIRFRDENGHTEVHLRVGGTWYTADDGATFEGVPLEIVGEAPMPHSGVDGRKIARLVPDNTRIELPQSCTE